MPRPIVPILIAVSLTFVSACYTRPLGPFVRSAHMSEGELVIERCELLWEYNWLGGPDLELGKCWKEKPEPVNSARRP